MTQTIIAFLLYFIAGVAKATSDKICWGDSLSFKFFWSRFYTGVKDKNEDGKVSVLEQFFPIDGWHLMEWARILLLAFVPAFLDLKIEIPFIYTYPWLNQLSLYTFLVASYNLGFIIFYYQIFPKL